MSNKLSAIHKFVEQVLINLVTERVMSMSTGVQESSTRGLPTSSSIARRARPSRPLDEKRTKHKDDLENAKLIPTILLIYIPSMRSTLNRDSLPRYFEYTLLMVYLPKGIHAVQKEQAKIAALKFREFNLVACKVYNMLTPHTFLTITKGKNSKIIPQSWTMNLAQSTLLNVMKITHFGRHQEVNSYVKMFLSCYHGGYFWLNHHIIVYLMFINRIIGLNMQGPDPQEFYPEKSMDRALAQKIKDTYGDVKKGTRCYKVASIQSGIVSLTY
jgi:hypothetical protein